MINASRATIGDHHVNLAGGQSSYESAERCDFPIQSDRLHPAGVIDSEDITISGTRL